MASILFKCPFCGKKMQAPLEKAGAYCRCRGCSERIQVPQNTSPFPSKPLLVQTTFGSQPDRALPEHMRANRTIEGRICPGCNKRIELGDVVFNCQVCGNSSHEHCYEQASGCAAPQCKRISPAFASTSDQIGDIEKETRNFLDDLDSSMEDFYAISGQIPSNSPAYGDAPQKTKKHAPINLSDDDLTAIDILLCIFCSNIGCILGIIYLLQGKQKGWKMIVLSFAISFVIGFIMAIWEAS